MSEDNAAFFQPMMDDGVDQYTFADGGDFTSPPPEYSDDTGVPVMYDSNFDQFDAPPLPPPVPADDYIGEIDAAPAPIVSDYESMPAVMVAPPAVLDPEDDYTPVTMAPTLNEASPMTIWNNEWQVTLKERKDAENVLKAQHIQNAEESLAVFSAQRESKREMRMQKNRSDEQDKLEAIEADLENDNSWQRVIKMVELNQDNAEEAKDCARMRDVLIFMKNDTDRASILA